METSHCTFSQPLFWCKTCGHLEPLNEHTPLPSSGTSFQFSEMDCEIYGDLTSTSSQMILMTDGKSTFFLDKSFSYGDFFICFFLAIFVFMAFYDFIQRFIYKIKVNFRH